MSFRNTFVTDFIYQGGEDVIDANAKVTKVFRERTLLHHAVTEKGYGYYAGIISTLSLGTKLSELNLESLIIDLEKVTKVPFRLTVLQESGGAITYTIEPRGKS